VGLDDCGISLPEAELMIGDETVGGHIEQNIEKF
jgi:hypothetical protein